MDHGPALATLAASVLSWLVASGATPWWTLAGVGLVAATGPIQKNHLSLVYRSSTSGLLKVAFSTPIWYDPPEANGKSAEAKKIYVEPEIRWREEAT